MGNHFCSMENSLSHYKWQFSTGITAPEISVTKMWRHKQDRLVHINFPDGHDPQLARSDMYGSEDWVPLNLRHHD